VSLKGEVEAKKGEETWYVCAREGRMGRMVGEVWRRHVDAERRERSY